MKRKAIVQEGKISCLIVIYWNCFHDALRQAEGNAKKTNSPDTPIVINRKNRQPTGDSLCLLRLDEFLKYYKDYLKLEGLEETQNADDGGSASVQRLQSNATFN